VSAPAPRLAVPARLAAVAIPVLALAGCTVRDRAPAAQSWRTVSAARQETGADSLRVRVEYGAGTLSLTRATQPLLYDVRLRYDESRFETERTFDSATSTLTLGVRRRGRNHFLTGHSEGGSLTLGLAPTVPLDLSLDLGAARGDLDLSGMSVRRLHVQSGASETRLRFGTPNATAMDELTVHAGAAGVEVRQLGNAHASRARVKCAIGGVDLDLSGAWATDMDLALDVSVGEVTLRIPRDLGVRVRLDKVLASFDDAGFTRDGDAYYSASWARAPHKLTIDAATVLGSIDVRWVER
jgi:hypothetical protein